MIPSIKRFLFAVVALFALTSCDKSQFLDREDYQAPATEAPELLLSLEATLGKATRSLSFDPANLLTPTVPEEGLDVLCIVRSSDPADQPIYRTITWAKDPNVPNRIYLRNYRLRLLPGMQLAGKRWYIMGVIGGEWDEANQQLRFSTNAIGTTEATDAVSLNVPAVSSWVELPTDEIPDPQVYRYTLVPFQAQGALVQVPLDNNKSEHDLDISAFTVVSTAFSFEGHYDLSQAQLPPIDNSRLGQKHGTALQWTATGENVEKEYRHTNAQIPEYTHEYQLPQPVKAKRAGAADRKEKLATFWVMPTGRPLGDSRTNVFAKATASGGSFTPTVLRLPIYGKNHTVMLEHGDVARLATTPNRPKLAIEYMAEYNVRRNDEMRQWEQPGDRRVNGSSAKFATNHGQEADSELRWIEAKNHGISGYHLPTRREWEGIFPFGSKDTERLTFKAKGKQQAFYKNVKVGSMNSNVRVDLYVDSINKTVYGLHFQGGTNQSRVAYRYRVLRNPDYPESLLGTTAPVSIMRKTDVLEEPRQGTDNPDLLLGGRVNKPTVINNINYLCVDMIYLGEHFLGSIEDIAYEDWWTAQRSADLVKRCISGRSNRNIAYEWATQAEYPLLFAANTSSTSRAQVIQPWVHIYWLDDPQTLTGKNSPDTHYPGFSRQNNVNTLFYFSPYWESTTGGGFAQNQVISGHIATSVRLFSDQ